MQHDAFAYSTMHYMQFTCIGWIKICVQLCTDMTFMMPVHNDYDNNYKP